MTQTPNKVRNFLKKKKIVWGDGFWLVQHYFYSTFVKKVAKFIVSSSEILQQMGNEFELKHLLSL